MWKNWCRANSHSCSHDSLRQLHSIPAGNGGLLIPWIDEQGHKESEAAYKFVY